MEIYLDMVFALNAAINYLLLRTSAALFGRTPRRRRSLLAASFGGLYACATFLPGLSFLSGFLWRSAALVMMIVLAYGATRSAVFPGAGFTALSMAMSGLILLLGSSRVQLAGGRVYYALEFSTLVLIAGAVYLASRILLWGTLRHPGGIVSAELSLRGKSICLSLLRDTGNTLHDPFTGKALPVIEWETIAKLLPEADPLPAEPVAAMERLHRLYPGLSVRLIVYRAVGTERAMLTAIKCDRLTIGKAVKKNCFVAISPTRLSERGGYEGLIGEGD